VLQRPRSWLLAHAEHPLDAAQQQAFHTACTRRASGEPMAYLLGEREFHGLMLQVGPAVLVPRPDTETLVDWALELLPAASAAQLADLGTGSGAIALALKQARPAAGVWGVDISPAALQVARANGLRHGLEVTWLAGDWWLPLRGRRFDLVLANPPYVAAGDPHLAGLGYEPLLALSPGGDGLSALRHIVCGAPQHLWPGGRLLLEHGHDQAAAVQDMLRQAGFVEVATRADLAGRPRCSGGRMAPSP
jgi:release factor glutamine methyltransferase